MSPLGIAPLVRDAIRCESVCRGLVRLEDGLLARQVNDNLWIVTEDGDTEPLWVRGRREFTSLTEAIGAVAAQMGRLPHG